jgi:hypothetical protein
MWYTAKRFSLIFTDNSTHALVFTRRHLVASREFPLHIGATPEPLLDWLWQHAQSHAPGTLCIPHQSSEAAHAVLAGLQDRYACYQQIRQQVPIAAWLDYQLYHDKSAKQTQVYWYALRQAEHQGLCAALEGAGFSVRGISTVPLLLRYAGPQQADRQGVVYLYQEGNAVYFCVYQNRVMAAFVQQPLSTLDESNLQVALNNLRQQVPLADMAQMIACTPTTQKLLQAMHYKTLSMNTAWDENIAGVLPEYIRLAGGLMAREWHELAA